MSGKLPLYFWTIRYMKPSQILWRMGKSLGVPCRLPGVRVSRGDGCFPGPFPEELDHDPVFLSRFSPEALLQDQVSFLHEREAFSWEQPWHLDGKSHLWNFNLHYFEFLHPLTKRFLETGDNRYLDKTVRMILGWIRHNPQEQGGDGWSAYTVSLRLTNWLSYYACVGGHLEGSFRSQLEDSIFQQYAYLSRHLEKHILGNHYFENLKALILCALFFDDQKALPAFLDAFRTECREEILPDGMHFERSPMYHRIVLEGLLRVGIGLADRGISDPALQAMTRDMLTAACSMEAGLSRIPLFNDAGDNVAKSLAALVSAGRYLHLEPSQRESLPDAGYYFFTSGPWRLIVDAGIPGPGYIPGHAHCDAMSFELYRNGLPVLTNSGTYAYQCRERSYFRSTAAHNTVQEATTEQSEVWSVFRLARRSKTRVLSRSENSIHMEMEDFRGHRIRRSILLHDGALQIRDTAQGLHLTSHLHTLGEPDIRCSAALTVSHGLYAPEFGVLQPLRTLCAQGQDDITVTVALT